LTGQADISTNIPASPMIFVGRKQFAALQGLKV